MLPKDFLNNLIGDWDGNYKLWLEPGVLTAESHSRATTREVLHGRFAQIEYDWSVDGEEQRGVMLLGRNGEGVYQMAWLDSWHNGDSIMFCIGGPELNVLGYYGSEDDPAGWRTEIVVPDRDHLVITAYNIWQGAEARATEARYERS
jgi:hypothetical protein